MKKIEVSREELKYFYEKKELTTYQIADVFDCCQATIWKRLHEFNIKPRFPWNVIDLPKEKLYDLYVRKKLSTWAIEKQYGYSRGTVHRKLIEYGIRTRNRAQSHIIFPRQDFRGNETDKAYLVGFAMGDLRTRKIYPNSETILVDCASTKNEQIELIVKLFKSYGKVWVSKPNRRGAVQAECRLNLSFDFLLKKRNLIDKWILKNKNYFAAFLAGFTDAEGCISISRQEAAYYSLGNYNKRLLKQIRGYLQQEKIHCHKLCESKTKGRLCFGKYYHNQNYWTFGVRRKKSLMLLFDLIGPHLQHAAKKKAMKVAKENIILRNKKFGYINFE